MIISIRGTIGRLAVVPKSLTGANITQDTARISLKPELNVDYVRAMLESSFAQRQIASFITGLAVQGINIGELRRVVVPIVGRPEQDELVKEIKEIRLRQRTLSERVDSNEALKKLFLEEIFGLAT